jgi:hypothetical protein
MILEGVFEEKCRFQKYSCSTLKFQKSVPKLRVFLRVDRLGQISKGGVFLD